MKKPSLIWLFLEIPRAIFQYFFSFGKRNFSTPRVKGDGHPVFVIPGLLNNSWFSYFLRRYLNRNGYQAIDWGLGLNTGKLKNLEVLSERIQKIHLETGEQVTLIGFSIGEVMARELAKMNPNIVRCLITKGAPFRGLYVENNVSWIYRLVNPKSKSLEADPNFFDRFEVPAPVPTFAMYSKTDGIVPWAGCMEIEDSLHQNIEFNVSHFEFVMHGGVFEKIGEILPQTKEAPVFQMALGI